MHFACKVQAREVSYSHIVSLLCTLYLGCERHQPFPTNTCSVSISTDTLSDTRMMDSEVKHMEEYSADICCTCLFIADLFTSLKKRCSVKIIIIFVLFVGNVKYMQASEIKLIPTICIL